jgi:hypothetical protein
MSARSAALEPQIPEIYETQNTESDPEDDYDPSST